MAKSPAFQFYPDSWLSSLSITLMTPAEEGAYIRLLCHAWLSPDCSLPADSDSLKTLSRLGVGWKNSEAKIRGKFRQEGERLFNDRLLLERTKQEDWRRKSSAGGKHSVAAKAQAKVNGGLSVVDDCCEPNINSSSSSPSPSPVNPKEKNHYVVPKEPASPKNGSAATHGSRFTLESIPEAWADWCFHVLTPAWDRQRAEAVFAKFADYWKEVPGSRGRKVDWIGTWRNWCRKEVEEEAKAVARNGSRPLSLQEKRDKAWEDA
jgi:uncharacterized protein YdaU (DUF1376 family)